MKIWRSIQDLVGASLWGFESPLSHQTLSHNNTYRPKLHGINNGTKRDEKAPCGRRPKGGVRAAARRVWARSWGAAAARAGAGVRGAAGAVATWPGALLTFAIVVGAVIRLMPVLGSVWPLGDGGLFVSMMRDIRSAGWALPAATIYNGGLPLAYPPLGLYFGLALAALTGASLPEVLRLAPAVLSAASVPAVWWLARGLVRDDQVAAWAAVCYALLPSAWLLAIVGGGITRMPGMICLTLALGALVRLWRRPSWALVAGAGVAMAGAILAHPEAGPCAALGALILAASRLRGRRAVAMTAAAAAITTVLVAPWLLILLSRYGPDLLERVRGAAVVASHPIDLVAWHVAADAGLPVWSVLALLGGALAFASGRWELPTMLVAWWVLTPRGYLLWVAPLVGVLAGMVLAELGGEVERRGRARRGVVAAVLFAVAVPPALARSAHHPSPAAATVAAMRWIRAGAPEGSRVAVIEPRDGSICEWVPAVADVVSVGTYQGAEWLGAGPCWDQWQARRSLEVAAGHNGEQVRHWCDDHGVRWVLITASWTAANGPILGQSLAAGDGSRVAWLRDGAAVIELP